MINLKNKLVLLTGGYGFLGEHVCMRLLDRGAVPLRFHQSQYDLTKMEEVKDLLYQYKLDYVIHCAGFNGGIVYNKTFPADIFHKNAQMALNIVEACRLAQVKKLVSVMTSCSYPDNGDEVLYEKDLWNGRPNDSIECHGLAKRVLDAASRFNNKQYGDYAYTTTITNLYGPGDTFNLKRTKVVGALIRKIVTAKQESLSSVKCLGTGNPKREFLYVTDAAEALIRVLEQYNDPDLPINIGYGSDVSIKELAEIIAYIVGYEGEIIWDVSAGDGQMKKLLDVSRMQELLDFRPKVGLREGLENTINWYLKNQALADTSK